MAESARRTNLYFAVCSVNIGAFAVGNGVTWTSPTLPRLEAPDSWIHLHSDQASWIGSLVCIGAGIGPFPGGYLANKFGRKITCYIAIAIDILSWLLLLFASSVYEIYIARMTAGIAVGLVYAAVPMYIGEIAEDSVRSALGSLMSLSVCTGYLLPYCVGPYVSYNVLIYCSLITPILFLLLFPFASESPYYLLQKGRKEDALASLKWLRKGKTLDDVEKELHTMQLLVEDQMRNAGKLSDLVVTPSNRYALMLSLCAVSFQQFSGINAILFYSQTIFDMTGSSISSSISTIIIGCMLAVAGAFAPPFARYFGIKRMFIVSAFGMALFQGILGFYFYALSFGPMNSLNWIPLTCLACYIYVYSIGFGPLPWPLMAEIFPANVKPIASSVSASLNWIVSFIVTRYFKNVSDLLGTYFAFWLFTAFCIAALLYSVFLVPDTKGKSLQEIQDMLNKRTKK